MYVCEECVTRVSTTDRAHFSGFRTALYHGPGWFAFLPPLRNLPKPEIKLQLECLPPAPVPSGLGWWTGPRFPGHSDESNTPQKSVPSEKGGSLPLQHPLLKVINTSAIDHIQQESRSGMQSQLRSHSHALFSHTEPAPSLWRRAFLTNRSQQENPERPRVDPESSEPAPFPGMNSIYMF